ncbi:hypothetical protein COO60DRAFT_518694 [Scenedesmus sp. NREL 46B-D3]|nr:hypothetical protein COO60DRAFT_518694 [Scenedesmus sp. NREL 46B-D3]
MGVNRVQLHTTQTHNVGCCCVQVIIPTRPTAGSAIRAGSVLAPSSSGSGRRDNFLMSMTLGSSSCCSQKAAGTGSSGAATLNNSNSFKDPFAALAQCSEPWQELDVEAGAPSEDCPLPEAQLSQLSIANEDDTLFSSADPAACDFLLVALAFQEQQNSLRTSLDLQLEDSIVTVAVGTHSRTGQQQDDFGSSNATAAAGKATAGAAVAGCAATSGPSQQSV